MEIKDIISIVAVVAAPIVAVWVGQFLQDRAQKRQDKMQIFKTLMARRASWTYDAVVALNIIEIVFSDDSAVVNQWRKYYDKLSVDNPTNADLKKMQDEKNKLLEIMAKSLGYKEKIKWEVIENPYIPLGMVEEMNSRQQMQNSQQVACDMFVNMLKGNEKLPESNSENI